jgi:hypothetical protein
MAAEAVEGITDQVFAVNGRVPIHARVALIGCALPRLAPAGVGGGERPHRRHPHVRGAGAPRHRPPRADEAAVSAAENVIVLVEDRDVRHGHEAPQPA